MRLSSTEFQLAVESCRSAFTGVDSGDVERLAATADWARFTRLVRFHWVQGLVWNALRASNADVPAETAAALASDAKLIAASNLQAAEESRQLLEQFEHAGIPLLFIKGLTVGAIAYPKPLLKMGWDIDLLIEAKDVARAASELVGRGYQRMIPAPTADLDGWHRRHKESVWGKADQRLYVELHTRLADNPKLIPDIGMDSPRRQVELGPGTSLPTLAEDELFAYLCVHGASSLWFRLKWITDLAAILHPSSPGEIERLYERSQQLGAGRASAQALLHADDLYGSLAGANLRARLERDRTSSWLAEAAMKQVAGRNEPREPTASPLGTIWIHLSQLLLLPGLRFKLGELARQLRELIQR